MGGQATTAWVDLGYKNITEFSMALVNLQIKRLTLMESKTSGALLKCASPSSECFQNQLFICILKSVSLGSIIETKTSAN
jgi:hypothetical protein